MEEYSSNKGTFRKVGECLYRYSNGVYYARFKADGKEIRRSLKTTDRDLARRNLADLKKQQQQIDRSRGKLTLRELTDQWLGTIQDFKHKTLEQKNYVAARIKEHWPTGSLVQLSKIKPSDCDLWLARCAQISRNGFSASSRNAHVQILKEVFALALRDRIISDSPAAHLKYIKRQKPIRLTPTWEQFQAIIADVRAQVFNADAGDSADFLEFWDWPGSARRKLLHLHAPMSILRPSTSSRSGTRHHAGLRFRSSHNYGHYLKGSAKERLTEIKSLRSRMRNMP